MGGASFGMSVLNDSQTRIAAYLIGRMLAFKAHPKGLHIEISKGGRSC